VFGKYGDIGASFLYGDGVGRYGQTGLADVIFDNNGRMKALTNFSGLATAELHPTKRLVVYFNYGEDYADRLLPTSGGSYGSQSATNTGCLIESTPPQGQTNPSSSPANCAGNTRDTQEYTAGAWYDFYKGAAGRVRYGVQYSYATRELWSGTTSGVAYAPQASNNMFFTSFRYYLP
jgi:hypothetical protein